MKRGLLIYTSLIYLLPNNKTSNLLQNRRKNGCIFIMQNRTNKDNRHNYDIVYGPVANDRVYAAFALYEGGLLNKQELIQELKTYLLVDQLLFHSERSLSYLTFLKVKEIFK